MAKKNQLSERLQLRLPPEWEQRLEAEAERSVTTKSEVARQAIIAKLRNCPREAEAV